MLTRYFYALFFVSLLFTGCKKKDDTPDNTFIINGVHDVSLGSGSASYLELDVKHLTGAQERVTITVTGLPAGITAEILPTSGTPDFSVMIRFIFNGGGAEGTYPIKIVGTAATYSKAYDLNLVLPPFSGFTVNGTKYRGTMQRGYTSIYINSIDQSGFTVFCETNMPLPTADGTYTYELEETPGASNSMQLGYFEPSESYYLTGIPGKTATLKISGGRMSLSIPAVILSYYTFSQREVSVSASE